MMPFMKWTGVNSVDHATNRLLFLESFHYVDLS